MKDLMTFAVYESFTFLCSTEAPEVSREHSVLFFCSVMSCLTLGFDAEHPDMSEKCCNILTRVWENLVQH